jgi:hypothetical protein
VSIAAMLVRPIGAALFPALAMSVTARFGIHQMLRFNRRAALVSCGCAIFVAFAIFFVLASTKYVKDAGSIISRQGLGHGIRSIVLFRLHEFGEMAINIPASKMGSLSFLIGIAGAAALAALLACAYARRDSIGIVEIYLLGYSCIMFVWPYEDARFWMPVLPLILLEVVAVTMPRITSQRTRHAAAAYAALYMAMGFAALAYSTRITFSGEDFPRLYGDGHLRSTYEQYYSELPANSAPIDESALAVLQRYAPHQRR